MEIINKSVRSHTFGSVITLPDGETVYEIGDGWDLSSLIESGEIELVKGKKKATKKDTQPETEPEVVAEEPQTETEEVKK